MRLAPIVLLACVFAPVKAQTITFSSVPTALIAGGGAQTLVVSSSTALAAIPLTGTWNGAVRPLTVSADPYPYPAMLTVSLTAADLAQSQLGLFGLYDGRSNALIGTLTVPVVYPVVAAATLYDASRGRVYLTTGVSTTTGYPSPFSTPDPRFAVNSLIAIDVESGTVAGTLGLGSPGGALAISSDATSLYVVVPPNIVRRVDPDVFTATGDIMLAPLPSVFGGTFTPIVKDVTVMPGAPATLAVQYNPDSATGFQFGIFDNGVRRANTFGSAYAEFESFGGMLFSPDGKYLFLGNGDIYPALTDQLPIDSTGFASQTPVSGPGGAPVAIVGNNLYTALGVSMDWHTMQTNGNLGGPILSIVDPVNSRILASFAAPQYATYQTLLQAFDLTTQTPLGSMQLPVTPLSMYRFGSDGLIFMTPYSILFFHTPLAAPAPTVTPNGVVSAASFAGGSIAPGEIVSIFGTSLGPAAGASFTLDGDTVVSPPGMEIWFASTQGTVLFASPGQMNAVAPFGLTPGTAVPVQVLNNGIPSPQVSLNVVAAEPALLTRDGSGQGLAAMVNQDGTINAPAPVGSVVSLFGTGGGLYPGARDGVFGSGISSLTAGVQVTIGGQNATVLYAGEAPELVGSVFQLNVQIPAGLASGSIIPVVVTIGGQMSQQGVAIAIR